METLLEDSKVTLLAMVRVVVVLPAASEVCSAARWAEEDLTPNRTTITAIAALAPHPVDRTLVLRRLPRTTPVLSTAAALKVIQATHLPPDSRTAKDMETRDRDRDTVAMARNNTLHNHSRDTVMAHRPVSVDSLVMADQLLATARVHHRQVPAATASKRDTEDLHTALLLAPTVAQETTITTSTTSMVVPRHTRTSTVEANSILHLQVKEAATAAHRVTTHPSPAGSKPWTIISGWTWRRLLKKLFSILDGKMRGGFGVNLALEDCPCGFSSIRAFGGRSCSFFQSHAYPFFQIV